MIKRFCQRVLAVASTFLNIEKGSILIYTGAFMAVGVGGAALSIDIGRIVLLRTQMQNRADAGALAGAAQLDSYEDAIVRAETVVKDSMKAWTTASADSPELIVLYVNVYAAAADNITRGAITTDDNAARFVEVILEKRTLSFFYAPAVNLLTGGTASNKTELGARAVAMSDPFVCKAQPLMICNPWDDGDPLTDDPQPTDPEFAGYGITLKGSPAGGNMAPGNFGFLALPADDAFNGAGNSAVAVAEALSAEEPEVCFGLNTLTTAPGAMMGPTIAAINQRFGIPWWDPTLKPAPNVINYYKDYVQFNDPSLTIGTSQWDRNGYWNNMHKEWNPDGTPVMIANPLYVPGGTEPEFIQKVVPRPTVMNGSSRYQLYLFEQGEVFYKKNSLNNKKTSLTLLEGSPGWTKIDPALYPEAAVLPIYPPAPNNTFFDGVPHPGQTVASNGMERRVLRVAVMDCLEYSIGGKDTYPASGQFLGVFIIRKADDAFEGGAIHGEIIGPVEPRISLEFHGNVRLVE